ncbi:nicotinamide riboside transporter PnuC [Dyella tabacisoli]|uniref:Nicotinamide riboside transporter PnuC n=1 Tax=Dyella tabacisoli TaxID=2282381 RepID=A0A369UND8_9GAMM|nr:nicotinamide riboside transporter PnuC [Dyella tabacisoli]RDD81833.1 nicotinamide riboside transporter PnuC [Dyella tabacisoli]
MTALELLAALLSAWGVWLTTRRNPWCWPIGLVSVLLYGGIFVDAKLYSDALLQMIFAFFLVYGWQCWRQHLGNDGRVLVASLSRRRALLELAMGSIGALLLGAAMHFYTDAALPWLDAALTAFSLVAQWWQARRHIAAWWLWIAVDVLYVGVYLYKSLTITAVLYAGFVALAALGWWRWRQASIQQTQAGFG